MGTASGHAMFLFLLLVSIWSNGVEAVVMPRESQSCYTPRYVFDSGIGTWAEAYTLANATVAQLTLDEKVGIVTGRGQFVSRCIGDTHSVPRLGIPSICMNDGPAGYVLSFPPQDVKSEY